MSIFLAEAQIRERLHYADLIPALREAFIDYSAGRIEQPLRPILAVPGQEAWFSVMPAVMGNIMGAKLVNVFPGNARLGLPTHLALIALFSAKTGELIAIMDGRLITEMRTAAASAIATDLLAAADSRILAILGSGVQARAHWHALRTVRTFQEVRVWSRNPDHALALAHSLSDECEFRVMTAEEAVRGADVVVTATHSPEPVLRGEWLKEGAHVNAVGAVGSTRRELDAAAVTDAYIVVESRVSAAAEAGDLLMAGAPVDAELGELLTARTLPKRAWSVYKSVGVAIEDLAAARLVV
jgi:ornithine cyclodeaminase/alanine dehydrogenase-like protein (mu-crystallin family)